jgi:hypothetical protein
VTGTVNDPRVKRDEIIPSEAKKMTLIGNVSKE